MNDEQHDDSCEHWVEVPVPAWRFSLWDVAGITLQTIAETLAAIADGPRLLARECQASANRSRATWDIRQAERQRAEAQAEIGADIRALIDGPDS